MTRASQHSDELNHESYISKRVDILCPVHCKHCCRVCFFHANTYQAAFSCGCSRYSYFSSNIHTAPNRHTNADINSNIHTAPNSLTNADINSNIDTNANIDSNNYANPNSNSNYHAYTHPSRWTFDIPSS